MVQSAQWTLHGRDPIGSRQFSRVVNRHSREYVRRALKMNCVRSCRSIAVIKLYLDFTSNIWANGFAYLGYYTVALIGVVRFAFVIVK